MPQLPMISVSINSAFGDLKEDKEFTDVTLACEDGQQVEAHEVVLTASSPFFFRSSKKKGLVDANTTLWSSRC